MYAIDEHWVPVVDRDPDSLNRQGAAEEVEPRSSVMEKVVAG